jgi:hypothetical protein
VSRENFLSESHILLRAVHEFMPELSIFFVPIWAKFDTDGLHTSVPKSCASRENWLSECHILLRGFHEFMPAPPICFGTNLGET